MTLRSLSGRANVYLGVALLLLGAGILRLFHVEGSRLDVGTTVLIATGLVWVAMLVGLFFAVPYKKAAAVLALALMLGVVVADLTFRLAGFSLIHTLGMGPPPIAETAPVVPPAQEEAATLLPQASAPAAASRPPAPAPQPPAVAPQPPAPAAPPLAASSAALAAPSSNAGELVHAEYKSIGTVSALMPASAAQAKPTDGASFLGTDGGGYIQYSQAQGGKPVILRVHLTANAYAERDNVVVLAVFREGGGDTAPLALYSKPVSAGGRVFFDETFDLTAAGPQGASLSVRMGVTRPGSVVINGPAAGAPHPGVPYPTLTLAVKR
ncbi:MAG TPA: hypothetical protein VMF53_05375 [Alphaproteobacteria bacterium]|nr:hypothetical protein [Alphaproteobacteria bacterium]